MSSASPSSTPAQVTVPIENPRYAIPTPLRMSFKTMSMVAPGPTAKLAWHIFAKPPKKTRPDRYRVMDEARSLALRAAGHDLAAWEWGDPSAPPVILLHGWGSASVGLGAFVRPIADAGFRVVAYDAHAHGQSPGVTTSGPEMAGHLNEIADRLGARHILAHSMGTVVTGFALQGGLDVERMVLLNGPADMPYFLSAFTHGLGFNHSVERRMIRRFEQEHGIRWQDCVVEAVIAGHPAPALLVHDDADPDVPWPHAQRVRAAWQNHRAITTRGMGHRGSLHSPEIVRASVDFLSGDERSLPEVVER